jgi:hypothetical protein
MKTFQRLKMAAGLGVLLSLAACGGGDGSSGVSAAASGQGAGPTGAAGAANTGQIASDSFLSQVVAIIGATSDTTEPGSIDSITATKPDTTEPFAIM